MRKSPGQSRSYFSRRDSLSCQPQILDAKGVFMLGTESGRAPRCRRAFPKQKLPAAEAEDNAGLDPEVVLMGVSWAIVKLRVKIIELTQTDGHVSRHLVVDSASDGHLQRRCQLWWRRRR